MVAFGRRWRDFPAAVKARARAEGTPDLPVDPSAGVSEQWFGHWFVGPDSQRDEFDLRSESRRPGTAEDRDRSIVVRRGNWKWAWDEGWGGSTNGGRADFGFGRGPNDVLLDPRRLVASFIALDAIRTAWIGRSTFQIHAAAYPGSRPSVGLGADTWTIVIDTERSVVLRVEAIANSQPIEIYEYTSVTFDEPIDPNVFVLTTADGSAFVKVD
jgi:hypothetical protein